MSVLQRTQYRSVSTGTVRTGATGHGESLVDVEQYLLPVDRLRTAALHSWGVVTGLAVRAAAGVAGVTVSTGSALDAVGQVVFLVEGGLAVVDPTVDPDQVQDVPTVPVTADGVDLDTAGSSGEVLLTVSWREVQGESALANAPVLMHAPWLRLVPEAELPAAGRQVVLARLSLDADGQVTAVTAGPRRLLQLAGGRLELRVPRAPAGAAVEVDQEPAAELAVDVDGGVALNLLGQGSPRQALGIDAATGTVRIGGALEITAALRLRAPEGRRYDVTSNEDGTWRLTDATAGVDRLVVDRSGRLSIGGPAAAQRTVHVEGSEVHSGGSGGGFSFVDRNVGGFIDVPSAGERWVWYSLGGAARLWSRFDRLVVSASGEGGGLDVSRRMRVRQGGDGSAGIWFHQTTPNADRAFVGMMDDQRVGFFGPGAGWALRVDTGSGGVEAFGTPVALAGNGGNGAFQTGVRGKGRIGVWGEATGTGTGVLGAGSTAGAFFGPVTVHGDLTVRGTVTKGGGGFKVDHPLAPDHRYLSHSFVESPEMLTVYTGIAETDGEGRTDVVLPGYFEALNRDHCFQLTPLGALALATVDGDVRDNAFTIRTNQPHVRVSWQVTGVRQDPWAETHRIVVEEDKPEQERGRYLHPEAHGQALDAELVLPEMPDDMTTTWRRST